MKKPVGKILMVVLLILLVGIVYAIWPKPGENPGPMPEDNGNLWRTEIDNGLTFQYPETLLTEYVEMVDWPPQVQVLDEPFACLEAGEETARAGQTARRTVNGRDYCVTAITEGAAGSVYTQYAYAFPRDDQTIIFTFSLRAPQCANYDEPQKSDCENERVSLDLDGTIDRMAISIR